MIIVLLGPPGSGKGTQGELISMKYGIAHLSSGELFRTEVEKKTAIGLEINRFLQTGGLVPDERTVELLHNKLNKIDLSVGVILDGYPRTLHQAEELNCYLDNYKYRLLSLYLNVPRELLYNRLKKRGRQDDIEDSIEKRLSVHENEIKPLLNFYKKKEVLEVIDASKNISEVFKQIDYVLSTELM